MSLGFIGISQRIVENTDYFEIREALSLEWGEFFKQKLQNYIPLPLSYAIPFQEYAQKLGGHLKGVILSGGNDLFCFNNDKISQIRDDYEGKIIGYCLRESLPLLGICRGAQRIASYFGATLKLCNGHIGSHLVESGDKSYKVNSFHNYCIESLGDYLIKLAISKDFSIEAFKHIEQNIFGIMWHIERKEGMIDSSIFREWQESLKG